MLPLLAQRTEADGDPYEILEQAGLRAPADELDERASTLGNLGSGNLPSTRHGFDIPANIQSEFLDSSEFIKA